MMHHQQSFWQNPLSLGDDEMILVSVKSAEESRKWLITTLFNKSFIGYIDKHVKMNDCSCKCCASWIHVLFSLSIPRNKGQALQVRDNRNWHWGTCYHTAVQETGSRKSGTSSCILCQTSLSPLSVLFFGITLSFSLFCHFQLNRKGFVAVSPFDCISESLQNHFLS